MNNPLAQKYNYYLNESHRLNEELKTEEAYSELLENVLFELLGEEDFTKLFEYVMQGTATKDEIGRDLSKAQSERRRNRIAQIVAIGREAARKNDGQLRSRVVNSLIAKGATADQDKRTRDNNLHAALNNDGKIKIQHDSPMDDVRQDSDNRQKAGSLIRRNRIKSERDDSLNTF